MLISSICNHSRRLLSGSLSILVPVVAVEGSNIIIILPGDGVQVLAVVHINLQVSHGIGIFPTEGFQFLVILRVEEGLHRWGPVASTPAIASRVSRVREVSGEPLDGST